ncbi:MAG: sulfatase-like hydrolase/transferase, partial [Bacteroidales bacterium]|nr:sulfatase-like hydrolase/transferase [Bacteroidales bacterium]
MVKQPNILFITCDQLNWMNIGYNNPMIKTPNIDKLAASGTIYNRAYSSSPVCTPTRASWITGLYPSQHGAYALGTKLPESVPCIGDYLKEAGYSSSLIGKAHFMPLRGSSKYPSLEAYPVLQDLDFWGKFHGPFYGFDFVELARPHGDESHVGQHFTIWMQKKLKREGKNSDEWKKWFRKPLESLYPENNPKMKSIMEKNGALNDKSQYGAWNIPENYHPNSWIASKTTDELKKAVRRDKPFFIWASFFDPHPPYLVPEPWASMYNPEDMILPDVPADDLNDMPYHYRMTQTNDKNWAKTYDEDGFKVHGLGSHLQDTMRAKKNIAIYYGMISMLDKYIGLILESIDSLGLKDNTIIVFTSDHGHHIGTHNLNAKGAFAFEEDARVPFIVSWKNKFPSGKKSDALISAVDIAPTFLSLTGREVPLTMSGIDLSPVWKGNTDSLRKWVIVENHFQRTKFYQKTYIEERYKITWYMHTDEGELFDLAKDPNEFSNLWDVPEYKELKLQLLHRAMQADMSK